MWTIISQYFTCLVIPFMFLVHDCRPDILKDVRDPMLWEAALLQQGLRQISDDIIDSHKKPAEENKDRSV